MPDKITLEDRLEPLLNEFDLTLTDIEHAAKFNLIGQIRERDDIIDVMEWALNKALRLKHREENKDA